MDQLEAVNTLLGYIGSDRVNSLTVGHPDVDAAVVLLNQVRKRAQRKGWWFNTDYNLLIAPEAVTKKVRVVDLQSVQPAIRHYRKRGDYMYDTIKQTYQFDSAVLLLQVRRYVSWNDLPDIVKDHVMFESGADFVRDETEDPNKEASLRESANGMLLEMKATHIEVSQFNSFDKRHVRNMRAGVRPARRLQTPLFTP